MEAARGNPGGSPRQPMDAGSAGDGGGATRPRPAVKAVERLTIRAATERSEVLALHALAAHPLVDSVNVARALLAGYRARIPELNAVFGAPTPVG